MTNIAEEAGVSVAVVSRLLRGDPTLRISEGRRQQIMAVRDRMGPIQVRRRYGKVIVAPVSRAFDSPWVEANLLKHPLYGSFRAELERKGFRLHFDFVDSGRMERTFETLMRSPASCGGFLILNGLCSQELTDLLREKEYPHVGHDMQAERFAINTVNVNQADGFRQAVDHLALLGHRRIGFLGHRESHRYPMVGAALLGRGLAVEEGLNCWVEPTGRQSGRERRDSVRERVGRWLEGRPAASALVCENDYAALGAVDALAERGLRAGVDLSVVGYDNIEERGAEPASRAILTTIDNPGERIGRRMAELLLNQIVHGQTQVVHERLPAKLIVRETTGKPIHHSFLEVGS
jgi:LacI family transcriptional regulator